MESMFPPAEPQTKTTKGNPLRESAAAGELAAVDVLLREFGTKQDALEYNIHCPCRCAMSVYLVEAVTGPARISILIVSDLVMITKAGRRGIS